MAEEFTILEVEKGIKTFDMPFYGLENSKVVYDVRRPSNQDT